MEKISFDGQGWEYFKIWIVNILLMIVTIGLYYPWAKVRRRRYFYGNLSIAGRYFDYHAIGKQLFPSYLIGIILVISLTFIQHVSPPLAGITFIVIAIATPWLIQRSMRFNLKMTSFSNVRFSFSGPLNKAYWCYLLLPLLLIIAPLSLLGIILAVVDVGEEAMLAEIENMRDRPATWGLLLLVMASLGIWFKALLTTQQTTYLLNHYHYGQGQFSIDIRVKEFVKIGFKSLALLVVLPIIVVSPLLIMAQTTISSVSGGWTPLYGLFYLVITTATAAYYLSRTRQYLYQQLQFDDQITFHSALSARALFFVMITNLFLIAITLGLAIPWTQIRMAKLTAEATAIEVQQLDDYIGQQEVAQSALGEQLADGLDIDIGIAV